MKKFLKIAGILLLTVILVAVAGFVVWGLTPLQPTNQALAALESDAFVRVEDAGAWIVFIPQVDAPLEPIPTEEPFSDGFPTETPDPFAPAPTWTPEVFPLEPTWTPEGGELEPVAPVESGPDSAFIFYPGGHVDYRAYAPILREIAGRGYMVFLVKMPLSLAVFGADRADAILEAYPDVTYWTIGGHSLGGTMAANYAKKHADVIGGLVLWASYPTESDDLSDSGLKVLSVYGDKDSVLNPSAIENSIPFLPDDVVLQAIEGGNHAQFGNYGPQPGDSESEIPSAEQQLLAADLTVSLLQAVAGEE